MKTSLLSVAAITVIALAASFSQRERSAPARVPASPTNVEGTKLLGRLPVAFVPNLGQWDHDARYVAKVGAMTVFLEEAGWSFTLVERKAMGREQSRDLRRAQWGERSACLDGRIDIPPEASP